MKVRDCFTLILVFIACVGGRGLAQTPSAQFAADKVFWESSIAGTNLAYGKIVSFSSPPNYGLTNTSLNGFNNDYDLTNGGVATCNYNGATRLDGKIWFCADAVGWAYQTQPVRISVDLGAVKSISRFAIRFLGGRSQSGLGTPKKVVAVASNDNVNFYPIAQLEKLGDEASALADDKTHYHVVENGTDFVKTFIFDKKIKARYVGFEVTADVGSVFTDELAVIHDSTESGATYWNTEYWRGDLEWRVATVGVNLAEGKSVNFSIDPDYSLTNSTVGDSDNEWDLTDGFTAFWNYTDVARYDGRIWFCADAVGWRYLANDVAAYMDLGASKAVRRLSIRILGGGEQQGFIFPQNFEVLASNDGVQFYKVAGMEKVEPAEASLADNKTLFYLNETGTSYVHTFNFDPGVQARYVGIRTTPDGSWLMTDEIAVLECLPGSVASTSWEIPENKTFLVTSGTAVIPRKNDLYITGNVVTPNWFTIYDARSQGELSEGVTTVLELPSGVHIQKAPNFNLTSVPLSGGSPSMVKWTLTPNGSEALPSRIYFSKVAGSTIDGMSGKIYTARSSTQNVAENEWTFQIHELTVPSVPPITAIDVGNGWVIDNSGIEWPDYLAAASIMGFNQISTFPRYFSSNTQLCLDARAAGFKIAYMESPFHVLQNSAHAQGWTECLNDLNGTPGEYLSPIYRGTRYDNEILRVRGLALRVVPDFVYFDIELWDRAVNESRGDTNVQDAINLAAASGVSEAKFFTDLGKEMMTNLKTAVITGTTPVIGLYNNSPQVPVFHQVFKWTDIYLSSIGVAMPSLYVHGDAKKVHDVIKACRTSVGSRKIIPWLTGGAYGEFDSKWIEPMILETILNGARGFIYYSFSTLDPQDYYFHAKALEKLAPYQELLSAGNPEALSSSNVALTTTCFRSSTPNEALVLVGNYESTNPATTTITSPVALAPGAIKNLSTGENLVPSQQLQVTVPGRGFVLLHYASTEE